MCSLTHDCKKVRNDVQNRTKGGFWVADISLLNCICHFEVHLYNLHFPHACIVKINLQFFLQTCSICFLIKREHNTSTSICTDRHTDGRKLNHGLFQPLLCMKHEDAISTLIQAMYRQNFNCIYIDIFMWVWMKKPKIKYSSESKLIVNYVYHYCRSKHNKFKPRTSTLILLNKIGPRWLVSIFC